MFTNQGNLESVLTVMKFDGDIDLSPSSYNRAALISREGDKELWYVGLTTATSDIEAFIIADKEGNFSYRDDSTDGLIINNVVVAEYVPSDTIEQIIEEYQIDGASLERPPKPGHIDALHRALLVLGSQYGVRKFD